MPISKKQLDIINFPAMVNRSGEPYDALIADGSVRSGKTTFMVISFVSDGMSRFNNKWFGICGKTVDSAIKNIIKPFMASGVDKLLNYRVKWREKDKLLIVTKGSVTNTFEVFGGKDEASYTLIQGRTLAGVLFDEVALQPRSFVEQAMVRCSVDGSKFWFNCNPESRMHWFNVEWVEKPEDHNALHLHFTLDDNPGLTERIKERYRNSYTGVFYQRYILGLWVMAEGLVYDMFDTDQHVIDGADTAGDYYISSDYGIQNATTFLLWQKERASDRWVLVNEYYYSGRDEKIQKTVAQLTDGLESILIRDSYGDIIKPKAVIVDPSASALITELRHRGYHVRSANNDVLGGIADVGTALRSNTIAVCSRCKHTINEFSVYAWDKKASDRGEDKPIKENDHCMDALRYFVKTMGLVKRAKKDTYVSVFKRS